MEVTEGSVTLSVPGEDTEGRDGSVFYNPRMELNRDLTVATLRAYRSREPRARTYLDAMAASGVRGLRAAADGWDVTMADVDGDAVERCRANLERNGLDGRAVHRDARALLHDDGRTAGEPGDAGGTVFDVVDVDPFGSPMPFVDAAFANTRNLVCVTATDTAPLCGAHLDSGKRRYAAVPRNTEYHAEMGLRVLLGALARTAARYDVGVTPLFSHVSDHYVRTYLELDRGATPANRAVDAVGHVYHCPVCRWRGHGRGLLADAPDACPHCGRADPQAAGPLWLDPAHVPAFVAAVREHVEDPGDAPGTGMGTATRARRLCDRVAGELVVPTHYDQHALYGDWGEPAPAMAEFLGTLRAAGYPATRSHYGGTTFKTTAGVGAIRSAAPGA